MFKKYKTYLGSAVFLNMLSAVFNIFSFSVIVPILNILFRIDTARYAFIPWDETGIAFGNKLTNNAYWYIGTFIARFGEIRTLLLLAALMAGLTLLKTACYFGASAVLVPIRTGTVRDLRNRLYDKILNLPAAWFTQERKGDLIARMGNDVQEVETSIVSTLDLLIKNPILIVFYFGFLLFLSPELTLFIVLFVPAFVWLMGLIGRNLKRTSHEAQRLWSDTLTQVDETLGGIRVIKAFHAEEERSGRFHSVTKAMRDKLTRVGLRQALAHPVSELLGTVMILAVLVFGGILIIRGKGFLGHRFLDASQFIFYLVILYSVIEPVKSFAKAVYNLPKGKASLERIQAVLAVEDTLPEPEHPVQPDGFHDAIRFEGVCFSYDGIPALHDIDLTIAAGQTVAIVGASGAGKTTLLDLLLRFYDPDGGRITLDGTDLRDFSTAGLRSLFGQVDQDPFLFNDTIFNNIAFGIGHATREEVIAAAEAAHADSFITARPEGYDTVIGDRGVKLSGGQRQRISIARALLKNPPVLLLDEATAALDSESEKAVQDALERLMEHRTTLVVAHRLSTIRRADRIVVLDGGRIVESGTHQELLEKNGTYRKLYEMQSF